MYLLVGSAILVEQGKSTPQNERTRTITDWRNGKQLQSPTWLTHLFIFPKLHQEQGSWFCQGCRLILCCRSLSSSLFMYESVSSITNYGGYLNVVSCLDCIPKSRTGEFLPSLHWIIWLKLQVETLLHCTKMPNNEVKQRKKTQKPNEQSSNTPNNCEDEAKKVETTKGVHLDLRKTSVFSLDLRTIACLLSVVVCTVLTW